jgi:cell division protein FtsI (penicillin-binding protein 3)
MLELAVRAGGTAPRAQVSGYRVGGKTGTAHKVQGKGYTNKYVSSFVGFAPASNPRLDRRCHDRRAIVRPVLRRRRRSPGFSSVMGSALRCSACRRTHRSAMSSSRRLERNRRGT